MTQTHRNPQETKGNSDGTAIYIWDGSQAWQGEATQVGAFETEAHMQKYGGCNPLETS